MYEPWALEAQPLQHADLDDTMLKKPGRPGDLTIPGTGSDFFGEHFWIGFSQIWFGF